ncbi:MAG: polysaccharide biosynthesis tyrosine autokinase [Cyanobacteria bacterium P01_F01_bin.42]
MNSLDTVDSSIKKNGFNLFTEEDIELLSAPEDPPGLFRLSNLWGMARRKKVLVMGLAFGMSLLMGMRSYQEIRTYSGSFQILVEPITDKDNVADLTGASSSRSNKDYDYGTQFEVLLSPEVLSPIAEVIAIEFPNVTAGSLAEKLKVYRLGETKTIEVKYKSSNPNEVQYVLEKVAEGYLDYSLNEQKEALTQGLDFVNGQKPILEQRVDQIQARIQRLRQEHNFIEPLAHANKLDSNRSEISQKRSEVKRQIERERFTYETLLAQREELLVLDDTGNYSSFKEEFEGLRRRIALERARFGENAPTIKMLRQQQDNLEPLLQAEAIETLNNQVVRAFNDLQILVAEEANLAKSERQLTLEFQKMPALARIYDELQEELKVSNESLGEFIRSGQSLQLQASKGEAPWTLIRPVSVPRALPKSSFARGALNGFVIGVLLSLVLAFIYERFQGAFFTVSDLKQRSRLPILGTIPYQRSLKQADFNSQVVDWRPILDSAMDSSNDYSENGNGLAPYRDVVELGADSDWDDLSDVEILTAPVPQGTSNDFLEAFRTLNTYINRSRFYDGKWSLTVTSASRGEGRTTVAIHLAQAAAAMGARVLLVDSHLQGNEYDASHFLGVEGRPGLGDYLMGRNSFKEVIRRLNWEENLYFINSGSFPADATRLLSSDKMSDFMDIVNKSFDVVIYITPAVMGLADLAILSQKTDGTLFVVKFGKWGGVRDMPQALEQLKTARIPVVGLVANSVKDYSLKWFLRN